MTTRESAGNSYERWLDGRTRLVSAALATIPASPGGLTLDVAAGDGGYSAMVAAALGTRLLVDVRGKEIPAVVVPTPFYKRPNP